MTDQTDDSADQAAALKPKRHPGTMSYRTTRFKSMAVALRELEQIIKSPNSLKPVSL